MDIQNSKHYGSVPIVDVTSNPLADHMTKLRNFKKDGIRELIFLHFHFS